MITFILDNGAVDYGRVGKKHLGRGLQEKGANLPIYPPDVPLPRLYVYGFRKKTMGRLKSCSYYSLLSSQGDD